VRRNRVGAVPAVDVGGWNGLSSEFMFPLQLRDSNPNRDNVLLILTSR
jgi:hypothetical protein